MFLFCREAEITKRRIESILKSGANVVLTTGGIDDMCMKFFVEAGAMGVRRCKKQDLKRIAKATGGELVLKINLFYRQSQNLLNFMQIQNYLSLTDMYISNYDQKFFLCFLKFIYTNLVLRENKLKVLLLIKF